MLTFKKGSYDKQDLHSLYCALAQSKVAFNCTETGCENCPHKKACGDITRLQEYVWRLIDAISQTEFEEA